MFDADLDGGGAALQAPDGAAAFVEVGSRLRMRWHGPEAHTDPQSLHYLLDERRACVWQSLGHQADWKVKGQGQLLKVLGRRKKKEWDEKRQRADEGGNKEMWGRRWLF